jgi:hypothetical protein
MYRKKNVGFWVGRDVGRKSREIICNELIRKGFTES